MVSDCLHGCGTKHVVVTSGPELEMNIVDGEGFVQFQRNATDANWSKVQAATVSHTLAWPSNLKGFLAQGASFRIGQFGHCAELQVLTSNLHVGH